MSELIVGHSDITDMDENGNILPNIDISVISYNRFTGGTDTGHTYHTDENGKCQLSIGGGD